MIMIFDDSIGKGTDIRCDTIKVAPDFDQLHT